MLPNRSGCEGFFGVAGVSGHGRIEDQRISATGEFLNMEQPLGPLANMDKRLRNQLQIVAHDIMRNIRRTFSRADRKH